MYTVRFHVVVVVVNEMGSARTVDKDVDRQVATPSGELKAVAIAAGVLATQNPELLSDEVEIANVKDDFDSISSANLRYRKAVAR